jgi:hypothetical protein
MGGSNPHSKPANLELVPLQGLELPLLLYPARLHPLPQRPPCPRNKPEALRTRQAPQPRIRATTISQSSGAALRRLVNHRGHVFQGPPAVQVGR